MSAENDPSFWKLVAGGILSAVGGAWGGWKYLHSELGKKADKHSVATQFQDMKNELATQRGHIAKVFDQMRDNEQRAQDRHERLMERLTNGHQ